MRTTKLIRFAPGVAVLLTTFFLIAKDADAADLKVLKMGVGSGTVSSTTPGVNCGTTCDGTFLASASVTLTARADPDSTFSGWGGDCSGTGPCLVAMSANHLVRAEFRTTATIPTISDFTPDGSTGTGGIKRFLNDNPTVNSPARFIAALPREFKQSWILMSRSESLQTGTAASPRLLLPSVNAQYVFTVGM